MIQTDNLNIDVARPLSSPAEVRSELPVTDEAAEAVIAGRQAVQDILNRVDRRHLIVVGPCSIHDIDGALDYARRLRALGEEVKDRVLLAMRVYFEKPRTTVGWKGLIYDPELNGSCDIELGIRSARRVLLGVIDLGLLTATEVLEPVIPQYITDLVVWAGIGARTAESQTHRQMASGLSMPTGFKNATDGNLRVAVEAIKTAMSGHTFIGIMGDGRVGVFRTNGNRYGHLVLRGGTMGPNYGSEHVAFARELMKKEGVTPNIMVDCSHGNSRKEPERQIEVMHDVIAQVRNGTADIIGTMIESNLDSGRQDVADAAGGVSAGISVTDPCLGWEQTEALIREVHRMLPE